MKQKYSKFIAVGIIVAISIIFVFVFCKKETKENIAEETIAMATTEIPTEPITEPTTEALTEPTTEALTEPMIEPINEPIIVPFVEQYQISNVPVLLQNSLGLPTGCEGVSLTMVLNYCGYSVSAWDVCEKYMPRDFNCTDPNVAFIGDPASPNSFGAYVPVLIQTAINAGASPVNLTGNLEAVYNEIRNGYPVVVWGTTNWNPSYWFTDTLNGTDYFNWHAPEHCLVLTGYTNDTVTINDPYQGVTVINRQLFETRWNEMGSQAMTVR